MKNPFDKKNNTGLVILLSVAIVAAGTATYLYLTERGTNTRKAVKHKLKDGAKNMASGIISRKTGLSKKAIKKVVDRIVK